MEKLIQELLDFGALKTPNIIAAFRAIDRKDFVLTEYTHEAYENYPLPTGFGQTISQPYTVAFMLELLQPDAGEKILDVGSGSGWQTAMLSYIVSRSHTHANKPTPSGKIFAIDIIPELKELGEKNISKYNFVKNGVVSFIATNAKDGLPKEAPFDKIIAAAALGDEVPQSWKDQLKIGGRVVTPVRDSIILLTKKSETEFEQQEFPGFAFVPFVK
ncbi:MAG: protein-L-isoaspartate O-methyltransferase [Candidatus Yonathbacteria bacterium]|nr:protein-L-isoaspartate O-methyltransferase [Candidatus Yonathbacteria bacterium]